MVLGRLTECAGYRGSPLAWLAAYDAELIAALAAI
jgi:hypothetical protein